MIKAKIKELLRKLTSLFVTVHTTTVTVASASYAGDARSYVSYNNAVPEGAIVLGIIVIGTPNNDWVRTMAYMDGRNLILRYHNEYSGNLTGQFSAIITYAIVGGVLRNLSIFKAFRHFMPLSERRCAA